MMIEDFGTQTPHDAEDAPQQEDQSYSEEQDYADGYVELHRLRAAAGPWHERLARHRGHQIAEQVPQTCLAGCASESHAREHGTPATLIAAVLCQGYICIHTYIHKYM